jgi:uncharacterized membrane protein
MLVENHSTSRVNGGSSGIRVQPGTMFGVNGFASGLGVLVVFGSGITAGLLFCVAFTIVPAFAGMTAESYVRLHKQLGRNVDRVMPFVVMGSMVGDIVLAAVAPRGWLLFASAAVALLGVSAISHLCNLPINKDVRSLAGKPIPRDWKDPRPRWRGWNLWRTGFSFAALALNGVALVVST